MSPYLCLCLCASGQLLLLRLLTNLQTRHTPLNACTYFLSLLSLTVSRSHVSNRGVMRFIFSGSKLTSLIHFACPQTDARTYNSRLRSVACRKPEFYARTRRSISRFYTRSAVFVQAGARAQTDDTDIAADSSR